MIVSIEHTQHRITHIVSKNTINLYNTLQFSNIYTKQINSINLHTSSFDNASHDNKPSRISHNSITLCRVFSPIRERADNLSLMKKTLFLHSFYEITK